MRLVMFRPSGQPPRFGVLDGDKVIDAHASYRSYLRDTGSDCVDEQLIEALVPPTTERFLRGGSFCRDALDSALAWLRAQPSAAELRGLWGEPLVWKLDDVKLCAPVMHPPKIICVGLNYRDHAEEQGAKIPRNPILFAKYGPTIVGPGDPVISPRNTQQLDYEAELAVVIGRGGRDIPVESALEHVAGYMCFNDITARDIQLADRQWLRGKTADTHAPTGPWLVTPDEVGPIDQLEITLTLNGETLQSSRLDQLIFSVPELISFTSETVTLEPGDIIATGTPGGVGFVRKPPRFMVPGDKVAVQITGLGVLENVIEAATPVG